MVKVVNPISGVPPFFQVSEILNTTQARRGEGLCRPLVVMYKRQQYIIDLYILWWRPASPAHPVV